MSDLVQRLRDDAANGATAYAKENYLEAADEIEVLTRACKGYFDQAMSNGERYQIAQETIARLNGQVTGLEHEIERLNGRLHSASAAAEELEKQLAEARADYQHELSRQRIPKTLSISDFEKGKSYQSRSWGICEYLGIDTYCGEQTLMFNTKYGRRYSLPEQLERDFGEPDA